ncbi:MAG: SDR family NAD(P)-dependent oxidoreductase [Candidatus Dojkabacteria bacterium]
MNLKNKIALVTGSTSGIGKAVAQKLMNEGCVVIVSSNENLDETTVLSMFENSDSSSYFKCDISKRVHCRL